MVEDGDIVTTDYYICLTTSI